MFKSIRRRKQRRKEPYFQLRKAIVARSIADCAEAWVDAIGKYTEATLEILKQNPELDQEEASKLEDFLDSVSNQPIFSMIDQLNHLAQGRLRDTMTAIWPGWEEVDPRKAGEDDGPTVH